jgi:hypothetical protein
MEEIIDRALIMGQVIIRNSAERGDVKAAKMDVKDNFGVDVREDVAEALMACGATIILISVGKALKSGAIKLDHAEMERQLREMAAADRAVGEDNAPITKEAESAAEEVLARIRKLH